MHPRISPGDNGLERGTDASYDPDQIFGEVVDCDTRSFSLLTSLDRLSFKCCSAATNCMVDTSANRVGCRCCCVSGDMGSLLFSLSGVLPIRRCLPGPIFVPAGICRRLCSSAISCSWNTSRSSGKFNLTVSVRCRASIAISTNI